MHTVEIGVCSSCNWQQLPQTQTWKGNGTPTPQHSVPTCTFHCIVLECSLSLCREHCVLHLTVRCNSVHYLTFPRNQQVLELNYLCTHFSFVGDLQVHCFFGGTFWISKERHTKDHLSDFSHQSILCHLCIMFHCTQNARKSVPPKVNVKLKFGRNIIQQSVHKKSLKMGICCFL